MCPSVSVCPWTGHWTPDLFQGCCFWLALFSPWPPTHKYIDGLVLILQKKKKKRGSHSSHFELSLFNSFSLHLSFPPYFYIQWLSGLPCFAYQSITYFSDHLFTSNLTAGVFFSYRQLHPGNCLSFSHPSLFVNLRGEREIRWEKGEGWK